MPFWGGMKRWCPYLRAAKFITSTSLCLAVLSTQQAKSQQKSAKTKLALQERCKDYWASGRPMRSRSLGEEEEARLNRLIQHFHRLQLRRHAVYQKEKERKKRHANAALEELPPALRKAAMLRDDSKPPAYLRRPSITPPIRGYRPGIEKLALAKIPLDQWHLPDEHIYQTMANAGFSDYEIRYAFETCDRQNVFSHFLQD